MKIILFLILLICGALAQAQTAVATSGNTTVAKTPYKQSKTTTTSVSVSISDNYYSMVASFDTAKRKKIDKLLSDNLDNNLFSTDGETKIWKKESKSETAYSFVLKKDKLKASIDKELVSDETFEKLKALGEKISETISEK
jgi:hypothetical protein